MASQVDSDFNECMAMMKIVMSTAGLWPLDGDPGVWSSYKGLTLMSSMFLLNILPQTAKAIESRSNFTLMLNVITVADINVFLTLIKMLTLWCRQLVVKTLVAQMCEDWETASVGDLRTMRFYARVSKWILRFLISTAFGTIIVYDVLYFATLNANTVWLNDTAYRPLFFISYFPFETHESPVFEIITVGQSINANLAVFGFISYDGLYVFFILHYSGQIYNLKIRMRNLVQEHRLTGVSFTRCIKSVIQRHSHLVSYTNMIEDSFNKTFLVQVFALSAVLCLQGYQLIKFTSETNLEPMLLIFTIFFTLTNLNSIFVYCAIAQVIRDKSLSLFDEVYQMQWYELPAKDALMIVIVMGRCTRPIELTVGKFSPLTLEYFARVMKAIAGYMSVLLAIKDKIME